MPNSLKRNAKGRNETKNTVDFFCALVRTDLKLDVVKEHRFAPPRRWRFDYAILEYKIAIEKEGGVWRKGGGAHSRPANIMRDMEKYTTAAVNGWVIIRRTPQQLNKQETLVLIRKAIEMRRQQNHSTDAGNMVIILPVSGR